MARKLSPEELKALVFAHKSGELSFPHEAVDGLILKMEEQAQFITKLLNEEYEPEQTWGQAVFPSERSRNLARLTVLEKERLESHELLRKARDLMSFDQWPEPETCVDMCAHAEKIATFLGEESEFMKRWAAMTECMAESIKKK